MAKSDLQRFGGGWTEKKLAVLSSYLQAYTTALKKQTFTKLYIDAFAGTGYRELNAGSSDDTRLFEELSEDEPQQFLDGSARIALQTDPAFDEFFFIEANRKRAGELRQLQTEFPSKKIEVREGDANEQIQKLCASTNWQQCRAVLFLDPFGMQVDWKTMEVIAATKAIDTWILFPLGIGVNRLLTRDYKNIQPKWKDRLDLMFGTIEWKNQFYRKEKTSPDLFNSNQADTELKSANIRSIGAFYHSRLKMIFSCVAPNPKILRNSTNSPIFQLHFAAGNPRGGQIALRIAGHILDQV
jgi:three-Cys-motif partner protein